LAAVLAESLWLSVTELNFCGCAAAEAKPQEQELPSGKPEAFRKGSGKAVTVIMVNIFPRSLIRL
jgi:hypothetical protein